MIIKSRAPTRVDLAGSTLDIWPLYLFHERAQTINIAINLYATCAIEERADDAVRIESVDAGVVVEGSIRDMPDCSEIQLLSSIVQFFKPSKGFNLVTESRAPLGSGLGGSSALSIALVGGLNELTKRGLRRSEILLLTQNLETRVIRVLTGVQDYYSALFGGLNSVHLGPEGVNREKLNFDLSMLQRQMVLCYTGKPHFSGTNNWEITKRHIEGDDTLQNSLDSIRDIAGKMRDAILAGSLSKIAQLLQEEWLIRKGLTADLTTPKIESLVNAAMGAGALAAKVCGAGGGGTLVFMVEKDAKRIVEMALRKEGGEILEFEFVRNGLTIDLLASQGEA